MRCVLIKPGKMPMRVSNWQARTDHLKKAHKNSGKIALLLIFRSPKHHKKTKYPTTINCRLLMVLEGATINCY